MIDEKMVLAINSKIEMTDTCWIWQGSMSQKSKTPRYMTKRKQKNINIEIRYYMYEKEMGKAILTDREVIKVVCGNDKCVNPKHFVIKSRSEIVLAGTAPRRSREYFVQITHCPQGHEYAGYNLIEGTTTARRTRNDGTKNQKRYRTRHCRTCSNTRNQQARMRRSKSVQKLSLSQQTIPTPKE